MVVMDNLTYARSTAGQKNLLSELNSDIDGAIAALEGKEYEQLLKVVRANWVGADEQKFEQVLKLSIAELKARFKSYKVQISTALTNDAKQFSTMQKRNADSISNIRI